jgi:hypothetical protein
MKHEQLAFWINSKLGMVGLISFFFYSDLRMTSDGQYPANNTKNGHNKRFRGQKITQLMA